MYPRPERSSSFQAHEYCRDAVCKKVFGIFPRKTSEELRMKTMSVPRNIATENLVITLDQIPSLFGGPILKFIAKGSYGYVFKFKPSEKYVEYLKRVVLPRSKGVIGNIGKIPTNGPLSIIKFQKVDDPAQKEAIRHEIDIHYKLSRNKISSKLYAAGFVGNIAWQISSYIDGKPMCDVDITADIFKNIEKAVFELWKHNVFHADLHCNNLMLTKDKDVVVIDFGRAIVLPDKYVPKKLSEFRDTKYQEKVQRYADSIITTRSKTNSDYVGAMINKKGEVKPLVVYSNDVQALRVFYDKMNESEKKLLKKLIR